MSSKLFFISLFLLLSSCGVKSRPISSSDETLPSYSDSFVQPEAEQEKKKKK